MCLFINSTTDLYLLSTSIAASSITGYPTVSKKNFILVWKVVKKYVGQIKLIKNCRLLYSQDLFWI